MAKPPSTNARPAVPKASQRLAALTGQPRPAPEPGPRRRRPAHGGGDRRSLVHRLHPVHRGLPHRCHPGRQQIHAHRDRALLHRLRAVRAGLPGRLHRPGERHRRPHRLAGLVAGRRPTRRCSATRPGASASRARRTSNAQRLEAKAEPSLADLPAPDARRSGAREAGPQAGGDRSRTGACARAKKPVNLPGPPRNRLLPGRWAITPARRSPAR